MKHHVIPVAALILASSWLLPLKIVSAQEISEPSAIITESNWQVITSDTGLFTIQMPGKPAETTETTTILGNYKNWQLFTLKNNSETYLLGYLDLSAEELIAASEESFQSLKQSILEPLDLDKIDLTGRDISLNGYPGKEFLSTKSGKIVAIRLYLVGQRLYGILAKSDNTTSISQYFNSFQVEPFWQTFVSDSGQFTIQLPDDPTAETEVVKIGEKELTWNLLRARDVSLEEDNAENLFGVGYANLSADWSEGDTANLLNTIGLPLLEKLNLQLLSNRGREIYLNDYPGIEFLGIRNGKIFAVRLYQTDNRLYGLFTAANELNKVEKFFTSFQINN